MPGLKWEVVKLGRHSSRMLVDKWLRQENQQLFSRIYLLWGPSLHPAWLP